MDEDPKESPVSPDAARSSRHDLIRAARDEVDRPEVTSADQDLVPGEEPGDVIGRYKLLQEVGEGGFGTVWAAEQLEPVSRRVALKLIRLGMDSKQVIARFESERQALAIMDHPRIAKVFDAGVTDRGRPYFVMEYVPGIPITEYCDLRSLDLRERLELFVQACEAIEHAHRKGIIHRDIKPSNLLVAVADGKPSLKVIDFGIAKATSQRLTERTLFTQQGMLMGTPGYMSPEQAGSTPLEVDSRTDIYALGVLLYELLVGVLPFDPKMLRRVALVELLRIIKEEDPPTPVARVASLGGLAEEVAKRRHLDARTLARQLNGDLEWITMRALEKDPERRYATASDFASDVGRYLANEPVTAGPPSFSYRLRKFVLRHKVGVVSGAAATVLMSAFGTVFAVQSRRLDRALEETTRIASEPRKRPPSRRLIVEEAGNYNITLPTPDGNHLLRYNLERRGYELINIESQKSSPLTSEGPDPSRTLFVNHSLSPDSRLVAGILWLGAEPDQAPSRDNDGGGELRLFKVGGHGEGRSIHRWGPKHRVQIFDWSPSQRRLWLWVMRPDRSAEIASIDVATGSIEVLKTLEWRSHSQGPSLSPDGRFVAYHDADQRDAPPDLFLLATDGGSEVRVEHPASDSKPLFTPDGTGLVFVSDRRPGFKDLWFLPVSEGRPAGPARIVWEDLDLLGTAMRFGKNGSLFYYFATNAWDVHTVDIDVSQRIVGTPKLLEPLSGEMNTAPAFSPDGSFLAHLRGGRRLVIRELATGREREFPVPRLVTSGTSLNWCTGGTSMIVTGFQSELTSFRVDLERGGAQHLDLEDPWRVQCLGSAEEVVYIRSVKKAGDLDTNHIVRRSLTSGEETILYEGKVDLLGCSADGAQISFVEKDETEGRLFVMSSSGGDPVTIAVSPTYPWMGRRWSEFRGAMWTSDGEALIVVRGGRMEGADAPSPEVTLWRYPLDGGEPTEVGAMQVPPTETGFVGTLNYSLHPDESSIAFERHVGFVAQVWAMDELLPFIQSGEHVQLASPHR